MIIKRCLTKKTTSSDSLIGKFFQSFKKENITNLTQNISENKEETLQIYYIRPVKPWYQNLKKDNVRKKRVGPISLIYIDIKTLNKILAKEIQEYIKRIIHYSQVEFIPTSLLQELKGRKLTCRQHDCIYKNT